MDKHDAKKLNKTLSDLFEAIVKKNEEAEVVVSSPLAIYACFAMLAEGVTGKSFKELHKVFDFEEGEIVDEDTLKSLQKLLGKDDDEDVVLKMSNSLYTNKNIKIKPEFIETIKTKYQATAESLDFSDPKTVQTINKRIAEGTNDLVKKAVDQVSPYAFGILINTIYFKCLWEVPFNKSENIQHNFIKRDESEEECEFMVNRNLTCATKDEDDYSYLALPYKSKNFVFVVEMAKDSKLKEIDTKHVLEIAKEDKRSAHQVFLPKFKASFNCDLSEVLKELDVKKIFSASKDFSKITEHQMCLTTIVHNAVVQVDEDGTEVSMFMMASVEGDISSSVEIPKFVVDRPFYFHIVDISENLIIFSGCVEMPRF